MESKTDNMVELSGVVAALPYNKTSSVVSCQLEYAAGLLWLRAEGRVGWELLKLNKGDRVLVRGELSSFQYKGKWSSKIDVLAFEKVTVDSETNSVKLFGSLLSLPFSFEGFGTGLLKLPHGAIKLYVADALLEEFLACEKDQKLWVSGTLSSDIGGIRSCRVHVEQLLVCDGCLEAHR